MQDSWKPSHTVVIPGYLSKNLLKSRKAHSLVSYTFNTKNTLDIFNKDGFSWNCYILSPNNEQLKSYINQPTQFIIFYFVLEDNFPDFIKLYFFCKVI